MNEVIEEIAEEDEEDEEEVDEDDEDYNFSLKEKSLGLSHLSTWETLYLQTVGRLPFVRSWMGL
jgi:PIN domain nuclease of toxin-antitoxin system